MLCVIFVVPGSPEEEAVNAKLNRNDPRNLAPFMIVTHGPLYPGPGYIPPIAVEFPDSRRNMDVYAEMHVADCTKFYLRKNIFAHLLRFEMYSYKHLHHTR